MSSVFIPTTMTLNSRGQDQYPSGLFNQWENQLNQVYYLMEVFVESLPLKPSSGFSLLSVIPLGVQSLSLILLPPVGQAPYIGCPNCLHPRSP